MATTFLSRWLDANVFNGPLLSFGDGIITVVDTTNTQTLTNKTLTTPTITTPVITGQVAVTPPLTTISADGAATIATGTVLLAKAGSATLLSVAAPGAGNIGVRMTFTSGANFAHVITFTGGTLGDGTTGLNTTVTMTAFIGSSITVIANTATQWVVESQNVLTSIA